MGKKSEKSEDSADTQTPAARAATQTSENEEVIMSDETSNESSAIQTAEKSTALSTGDEFMALKKDWAAKVPHKRADIFLLNRPSPEELVDTVVALSPTYQKKMMEVVRKTNPKKQGAHTSRAGFAPIAVRLYQGTGNDPVRPRNTLPGEYYTADSRVLGNTFKGAVIGFYEGRIMWPLRDQSGGSGGSNAPLCFSLDRKMGNRYGECAKCPNASKPYNQGGCAREVVVWFIDEDMSGVYEMRFSKSSQGAGEALTKILAKSENIWDRWVEFGVNEKSEGQKRWFTSKAGPVSDTKKPENNFTPKELHKLYESISQVIDFDVYYPGLADSYDRSKNSSESSLNTGGAPTAGDTFDEKKFLGNAATDGDNPDYGSDVPNV